MLMPDAGTTSFWVQHNRPDAAFDCAVVGAGIVGCSTAYWLHRLDPDLRIAIVERRHIGSGASGRNAGFVLQGTATAFANDVDLYGAETARRLFQLTLDNRNLIFDEIPPEAIDARDCGSVTAAGSKDEATRLARSEVLLREQDFDARYLDSREVNELVAGKGFFGGLYLPTGAEIDPIKLVRHVAEQSRATVFEYDPVVSIDQDVRGIRIETERRSLTAAHVFVAANAYLPLILPAIRFEGSEVVTPIRAQMLVTDIVPQKLRMPVYSHDGYYYIRQHRSGRVLVGGARHLHKDAEVGYDDVTTTELQTDLENYLQEYFPALTAGSISQRWSGTMGFSPDSRPTLGEVPNVEGAYWMAGFTGHGMSIAFRIGQLVARTMLGQPDEYTDLFAPGRFSRGVR